MQAAPVVMPLAEVRGFAVTRQALRWRTVGAALVAPLAAGLWVVSLRGVDLRRMTDLGLISVLPPLALLAFAILAISFCLTWHRQELDPRALLAHVVALLFMLYGAPALVEETPRFVTTWRLAGIAEYVSRNGRVDPNLDAFHNWPGLFILNALVTQVAGLQSPLDFAAWAPVFFNVLYLGPLSMILRSAASDDRLLWLGLWFFCLANWAGQDYLSPQGLNFFLYLVVLAILLRWFGLATTLAHPASRAWHRLGPLSFAARRLAGWFAAADVPAPPSQPWQRVGLIGVVIVLLAVSVSSHQLTPFFLLAALTALVVADRVTPRGLPVLLAVMIGAWLSFMAVPYLSGHLAGLVGEFGRVAEIADANVAARLQGSPEHLVVVRMRVVMSLALWGLAVLGALGRVRRGHRDLTMVLLGATPFSLLALQAYGGEMAIRVYLFALPPVLFFTGALLCPTPTVRPSGRRAAAVALTSLALLVGFLVARYGNERMDHFTRQEADAVQYLYAIAEPGSALIAGHWNLPWMFRGYETYLYTDLDSLEKTIIPDADASALLHRAKELEEKRNRPVYIILTRSQEAAIDLMQGLAPGSLDRVEQAVRASGDFRVVFHNEDATILVLARTGERR